MSYDEYYDLYLRAQKKGQYHMFVFDVKGSKNYQDFTYLYESTILLLNNVLKRLSLLEKEKPILHKIDQKYLKISSMNDIYNEPFHINGDLFGFTIIRDSLSREEVYEIFEEEKIKLNLDIQFHQKDGYYETDDYNLINKFYYRGYAMKQLENLSKEKGMVK